MKALIEQGFNQGVATYDEAACLQKKVAMTLAKKLAAMNPHTILEVGCGTGIFTEQLCTLFPQANFLLTDLAPKMVEHCRQRYPQLTVTCHDIETMIIPHEFDLIASSMTFHWLEDLSATLTKLKEKLTEHGSLVFSLVGSNAFPEWKNVCRDLNMPHGLIDFPCLTQLQKTYPNALFSTEIFVEHYRDARDFLQMLKKLGAHTAHPYYQSQRAGQLRTLIKYFDDHYPQATITYEIIYGWVRK